MIFETGASRITRNGNYSYMLIVREVVVLLTVYRWYYDIRDFASPLVATLYRDGILFFVCLQGKLNLQGKGCPYHWGKNRDISGECITYQICSGWSLFMNLQKSSDFHVFSLGRIYGCCHVVRLCFCWLHLTSPPFPELNVSFIPYSHAAYFSTQERAIMPSSAHVIVAKKVVSSLQ
jgi:hypothetical protein